MDSKSGYSGAGRGVHKKYKDKKVIVIGYNDNWKSNVNMGRKNNRKFYQIPYRKLLYKMWLKFKSSKTLFSLRTGFFVFSLICHLHTALNVSWKSSVTTLNFLVNI